MDIGAARLVLRERTLLDVFDLTAKFVVSERRAYAKTWLVALFPLLLVEVSIVLLKRSWVEVWLPLVLASLFADALFTILASRLVFEESVSVRSVLKEGLRGLPRLAFARLLQAAGVLVSGLLFVLPGLWVMVTTLFLCEVVVLERSTFQAVFTRCRRMLLLHWGDAALAFVLILALIVGGSVLSDVVLRTAIEYLLALPPPEAILSEGFSLLGLLGYVIVLPVAITVRFLVYLNIRTRTEGWDIQTRFVALATELEKRAEARLSN